MAEPTQAKKARLEAYLRSAVLTLALEPGSDLDEAQLCDAFGLSRTPLREVLRELAGAGYLSHRTNRGIRVAELSHTTLRAFFQAAPMIYAAVLQLAAVNRSPAQIDDLKAAQDAFKAALRGPSVADRALANNRFHDITGEMAGNPYLHPSFQRLLIDHARIGMTFYQPQNADRALKLSEASAQHDAIITAIEARDAEAAGQLALDHWQLSRSEIESYVMPTGLDAPLGQFSEAKTA